MPVIVEYVDEIQTAIVKLIGGLEADEINAVIQTELTQFALSLAPQQVHIIFEISELKWSFTQFTKYMGIIIKRRSEGQIPSNVVQYFVGSDRWLDILRTLLASSFNESVQMFTGVDDALAFITDNLETGD